MNIGLSPSRRIALSICIVVTGWGAAFAAVNHPVKQYMGALQWREVGPNRGGRVDAVAGVPSQPEVFYFGAAAGGVWKTTDAGVHWKPLFQHQDVASVGALAVSPSDPKVIYAGTGEAALRSNVSFGDGVYRSSDGGKTWRHVGLVHTRHIGKILVDPKNSDKVLVAALGSIYRPNHNGGIYLTTDGGKRWKKVLYVNDRSGGIDLAVDPDNARIIYAATWEVWRKPWILHSGGPGSRIYKSTDGGETWHRIKGHGLPTGTLGRIGLAVSKNGGGEQVYAMIEAKKGGVYRSDDGGRSWKRVNKAQPLRSRPFYFTKIVSDPGDPDTVYVLDRFFFKSTDQGWHFADAPMQGGDNHDLWINPLHPKYRIEGNDQGAVISTDGGKTWTVPYNEPIAQMYHVNTDNRYPYNLYGEQQDSGSIIIPSMTFSWGICGITDTVGGGESGFVVPQPGDPDILFADTYMGQLTRYNRKTRELKQVSPWPYNSHGESAAQQKYRFTWVSPLVFSPQNPDILYMGSQVLFKSTNLGQSWSVISPDLSRDDKSKQQLSGGPITKDDASAEYYDLIYSIAPSPKRAGEIWAGTDDGLVWLTMDGGKHWKKVTPAGIPKWSKISMIDASTFDAGTAYLVADAHKLGVSKSLIFRTTDYGKSWVRITDGLPAPDYAHVVRQDPVNPDLLYAGTERGIFVSFDNGGHWHPLNLNLPTAPVEDLKIHDGDLIAATFGRGYWILDNISPLRQFNKQLTHSEAYLYQPAKAVRFQIKGGRCAHSLYGGSNPPMGAVIDFNLDKTPDSAKLTISDAQGNPVRTFSWHAGEHKETGKINPPKPGFGGGLRSMQPHSSKFAPHKGLNRLVWNLRYQPLKKTHGEVYMEASGVAPMVLPGSYTVKLTVNGKSDTRKLQVVRSPLAHSSSSDLAEQKRLLSRIYKDIDGVRTLVGRVQALQKNVADAEAAIKDVPAGKSLVPRLQAIATKLSAVNLALHQPKAHADEELFNYPVGLDQQLSFLDYVVASGDHAPTKQSYQVYKLLSRKYAKVRTEWRELLKQVSELNATAQKSGIGLLVAHSGT